MATRPITCSRETLHKHISELRCLYGLASVAADRGATLDEQAGRIAGLLREAFNDRRQPYARVTLGTREYTSGRPAPGCCTMTADVLADGERAGAVEIGYRDAPETPPGVGTPETLLLNAVAERLGGLVEQRLKTDLLATVSHELRTPLATIKGYATMMLDYASHLDAREVRSNLQAIDTAADRLNRLVDNLLESARLEAGPLRLETRPGDLGELIERAAAEAKLRTVRHTVTATAHPENLTVTMDERRIRQVLDNLVENAIRYAPEGGIFLSARKNGRVRVCVADEGPGIPPGELRDLFRGRHGGTRAGGANEGLGLGLSLCRRIVEAHGGTIRAANRPGGGLEVSFTLPCREEHGEAAG